MASYQWLKTGGRVLIKYIGDAEIGNFLHQLPEQLDPKFHGVGSRGSLGGILEGETSGVSLTRS